MTIRPEPFRLKASALDVPSVPLEVRSGHLVVHLAPGAFIVDTGAPVTVRAWPELCAEVGAEVCGILGLDHLDGRVMTFDTAGSRLHLGSRSTGGEGIGLERGPLGVPLVEVEHDGAPVQAILDTGAQLSYAPADVIRSGANREMRWDFAPGLAPDLGRYEVETADVTWRLAGRTFVLRHAIAPAAIAGTLEMLSLPQWIVGAELLIGLPVTLDLARNRLSFPGEGAAVTHTG